MEAEDNDALKQQQQQTSPPLVPPPPPQLLQPKTTLVDRMHEPLEPAEDHIARLEAQLRAVVARPVQLLQDSAEPGTADTAGATLATDTSEQVEDAEFETPFLDSGIEGSGISRAQMRRRWRSGDYAGRTCRCHTLCSCCTLL